MYKIEIENNVTHQKYTYDNVEDKNNGKKLFYNFNINTSNLDDGEYTLSLYDGNKLITSELLKIGDFNNKSIQYSKGSNVFIDAKPTKIDVAATGIKLSHSTFSEIPDIYDFSNVTNISYMFESCNKITTIQPIDTSNATNMEYLFGYCSSLTTIPLIDTSNVKYMQNMFYNCIKLQSIPPIDTSNVIRISDCFYNCYRLQSLPLLECGKITNADRIFGFPNLYTLTDLGGFKDLKVSVTSGFLNLCPKLTVDSLMNVINYLYDLTSNGLSGQSLNFGQTNLDKLTPEQIAVATNKGWTLIA